MAKFSPSSICPTCGNKSKKNMSEKQNGIVMPFCSLYMLYKFLPRRLCGLPTQKRDCLSLPSHKDEL